MGDRLLPSPNSSSFASSSLTATPALFPAVDCSVRAVSRVQVFHPRSPQPPPLSSARGSVDMKRESHLHKGAGEPPSG